MEQSEPLLLGGSAAINVVRDAIASAARTQAKVLITGETGVGKEVVARLLHQQSPRATRAFVPVNCSGIPETLLESELFGHTRGSFTGAFRDKMGLVRQADRGTLFLDELGEMSLRMQAVLLRFTETGEFQPIGSDTPARCADVRLITATNRDLRAQIAASAFREDLYYRLNVIQIHIPALRERAADIQLLFDHYLARAASAHGVPQRSLTAAATDLLLAYSWPGNVRELRNVTERLALQERTHAITPEDLPAEIRGAHASSITGTPPDATRQPIDGSANNRVTATVDRLWARLEAGEDFWSVVREAFKAHEITRTELIALIDRGLQETRGSYRALVRLFNLPPGDYKRFHSFLYQHESNLSVKSYRLHMKGEPESRPPRAERWIAS